MIDDEELFESHFSRRGFLASATVAGGALLTPPRPPRPLPCGSQPRPPIRSRRRGSAGCICSSERTPPRK
ncbi:twin-arginine translocation signal domain-containing protein [Kribbella sp. NPDC026596]|uniref:twin-arginine translocation signal domain-containing protein n=1 Tax=Kribbella sp. NPDC026596 TaxID=3155122 RepID=UPI0033DC9785